MLMKSTVDEKKALQRFTNLLFEDDVDKRWQPKVRELLVMALFLQYEQFCVVRRSSPEAYIPAVLKSYNPYDPDHDIDRSYEFNTIRNHLFVCHVDEALSKAGASGAMIPAMPFCPGTYQAYRWRNYPYTGEGKPTLMDVRCFSDHFNALSSISQATHVTVQQMHHQLNNITDILRHERIDKMEISEMRGSLKKIENHFLGSKSMLHGLSGSIARKFSISSKAITGQTTVTDATVMFIVDNFPAGMALEQKSGNILLWQIGCSSMAPPKFAPIS